MKGFKKCFGANIIALEYDCGLDSSKAQITHGVLVHLQGEKSDYFSHDYSGY